MVRTKRERERELALKHKQEMAISCLMVSSRSGVWLYPAESLGNLLFCFLPFKFLFFFFFFFQLSLSLGRNMETCYFCCCACHLDGGAVALSRTPKKSPEKK